VVDVLAHGTGAGTGGFDPTVTKDFGGQTSEESTALVSRPAEAVNFATVSHREPLCAIADS